MDRLLARLERRIGRFAIPNLAFVIVAGMAVVFVLGMIRPRFEGLLTLDLAQVRHGQVWRLITYLFLPPPGDMCGLPRPIVMLFVLYFIWLIGTNLENEWGAFKFNAFYLIGMVGTTIAALVTGGAVGNTFINESLFLAFATLFPDFVVYMFLIIPVKVKWLGILAGVLLVWQFISGDWVARAAIFAATGNYVLFFTGFWRDYWKSRNLRVRQSARRAQSAPPARATGGRRCAICDVSEDDGADIRVCSCEKCGGKPRNLCLEHARNH